MKLLLHLLFLTSAFSAKAPICTSVLFSAQWHECSGVLLYAYSIQMSVTVDKNNQTFPNIITLSKISEYSANYRYYFADTLSPITYSYIRFWNDEFIYGKPYFVWNSTDTPYSFHYPNGRGEFDIRFFDGYYKTSYDEYYEETFIHNGEIFMDFFPLASPCLEYDRASPECGIWNVRSNQSICCNNFIYVDIPNNENEVCQSFQSTTTLKDSNQLAIATLNASFFIDRNAINLNVTDFKTYNLSINSRYAIGDELECEGNNGSPYSTCTFYLPDNGADVRYNFLIDYEWIDQNQNIFGYYATAAILVHRNGIFLKDDNTLFTSKIPCWKLSAEIAYGNGTYFDTLVCCTSFTPVPSISTSSTVFPSPITKPAASCLKYSSMTSISNGTAVLKVEYKLNTTGMEVIIEHFREERNSSLQLEVYSIDSFSSPCTATSADPTNQCFFTLSDNKKYDIKMRTSIFKDGFNMYSMVVHNGGLTFPLFNSDFPCYAEIHPYNDVNSNVTATTGLCCDIFGYL